MLPAIGIILIMESDSVSIHVINTVVANGCPVYVAGDILHGIPVAVKGLLQEWQPVLLIKTIQVLLVLVKLFCNTYG